MMAMVSRSEIRRVIAAEIKKAFGVILPDESCNTAANAAIRAFESLNYVIPADRPAAQE